MFINKIEEYLSSHLVPSLRVYNFADDVIFKVVTDIKDRLYSVIYRWNDSLYRKTILEINNEIAVHYKPNKNLQIRSFVATSIRNSLLEELSCDGSIYNLDGKIIPDADIPKITSDAIQFFAGTDLSELSKSCGMIRNDVFGDLPFKYPAAWTAFQNLSTELSHKYSPIKATEIDIDNDIDKHGNLLRTRDGAIPSIIMSGMDSRIDVGLAKELKTIRCGEKKYFCSDSFKSISRNPHKLLKIIEFILAANASVVTANYYIENGYVEKRELFLKPAHSTAEMINNISNLKGTGKKHREALKILGKERAA